MRAALPWMDAVVSLRVRDWVKKRRRRWEKKKKKKKHHEKEKDGTKKRKSEIRRRNDARLRSCFQPKMHGVPPECRAAAAAAAAADVVVSLRAGPGRLAGEHTDTK